MVELLPPNLRDRSRPLTQVLCDVSASKPFGEHKLFRGKMPQGTPEEINDVCYVTRTHVLLWQTAGGGSGLSTAQ